ncbi:MAG: YdeI/OmpD-associated family protein [Fibrobacterota bacterium]|nr:YdeI/OmpD-associated family protein [Fibrobacterota bacterium]QQS05866.1 MAG: YdeI/OmpD-associated family protein [Fibrobacterota bacterium]
MNPKIDQYLEIGCGRCALGGTPDCKVHTWTEPLKELRRIALSCGLTEELKWGMPCYTSQGKNIAMVVAFKEYCALSFFKGSLLKDPTSLLQSPGENSQSIRLARFTAVAEIKKRKAVLESYIREAIDLEKSGAKVAIKAVTDFVVPEEFQEALDSQSALKAAFDALTPGRRKAYLLHFSGAKQSATRRSRIEKCLPRILEGKGLDDR